MTQLRFRIIMISVTSLASLLWFVWWCGPAVQADRTFTHLRNAIEKGQAGGVLDVLHPGYDFALSWPTQIGGQTSDPINGGAMRLLVMRGLTALFQLQQVDPFVFQYTIQEVTPRDDGNYTAIVSITLTTRSGERPLTFTPPLTSQSFILAKESWWPSLTILSHPPLHVAY
jgi:hypothetical protein